MIYNVTYSCCPGFCCSLIFCFTPVSLLLWYCIVNTRFHSHVTFHVLIILFRTDVLFEWIYLLCGLINSPIFLRGSSSFSMLLLIVYAMKSKTRFSCQNNALIVLIHQSTDSVLFFIYYQRRFKYEEVITKCIFKDINWLLKNIQIHHHRTTEMLCDSKILNYYKNKSYMHKCLSDNRL